MTITRILISAFVIVFMVVTFLGAAQTANEGKPSIGKAATDAPKPAEQLVVDPTLEPTPGELEQLERFEQAMAEVQKNYIREVPADELIAAAIRGVIESIDNGTTYRADDILKQAAASQDKQRFFRAFLKTAQSKYESKTRFDFLVNRAIKVMVGSLGDRSLYLSEDVFKRYFQICTGCCGKCGMVGVEVTLDKGRLTVIHSFHDSPAYRAGLIAGDRIVKINGDTTKNISFVQEATDRISGAPGTKCTLTVENSDLPGPTDFTITRKYPLQIDYPVKKAIIKDGYLYVKIPPFGFETLGELVAALSSADGPYSLKGIVIDLRDHPGGVIGEAPKIAGLFLNKGLIIACENGRSDGLPKEYISKGNKHLCDLKLAILVNRFTTGGGEIFAAAIQDHNRGLVLGSRTFGYWTIRSILPLKRGDALLITKSLWRRPNGGLIRDGITPDIEIKDQVELPDRSRANISLDKQIEQILETDPAVAKALEWLESEKTVADVKAGR